MDLPGLAWACPWPKMASKWVKMNFPEHGVNRKVVDNGLIHLNVQYERSSQASFRENQEKPDFSKIAYKKKLRFFSEKPSGPFLALIVVNIHVQKLRNS